MKVLVTGVNGQLGYDVVRCLEQSGVPCVGAGRGDFDLTDAQKTQDFLRKEMPTAVIHCAAYTAVDKAEEEKELCRKVNVEGTRSLALACQELGCKLVYISTDYVFPGNGDAFYEVSDPTEPLGQYGKTKLLGEEIVKELLQKYFIVRVSWVFGKNGGNFVKTMLRLGKERPEVSVVADQVGSPTYTADLAPLICHLAMTEKYGTYHATNEGVCSWAEFAREIFRLSGLSVKVREIGTEEYPTKAVRPKNSRLSKKSLDQGGFSRLPHWKDALGRYLQELEK